MQIKQEAGVSGEFSVRVLRADGTVKLELPTQPNLVTDNGLRLLSFNKRTTTHGNEDTNNDIFSSLAIGTGSGTPANTDTALFNMLKFADETTTYASVVEQPTVSRPHFVKTSQTKRFIFKNINNKNITELGLAHWNWSSSSDPDYVLYTHALLKNSLGTPTAVTVLGGEVLEITYTFNVYYDIRQQSGSFKLKTLANNGDVESEEVYDYRLQHYGHTDLYVSYGLEQSYPYPAAWAATVEAGVFDWSQFPPAEKSLSVSEMEGVLNNFTLSGSENREYSGSPQWEKESWSITDGRTLLEIVDRSANSQRFRITTSPYIQNYANGIRALLWDNGYNGSSKLRTAVVVAEKTTGKGIMKTNAHKLTFEVVTTHSRYEGNP